MQNFRAYFPWIAGHWCHSFSGRQRSHLFFCFFLKHSFPFFLVLLDQIPSLHIPHPPLFFWFLLMSVKVFIPFPFQPTYLLGSTIWLYSQFAKYDMPIFSGKTSLLFLLFFNGALMLFLLAFLTHLPVWHILVLTELQNHFLPLWRFLFLWSPYSFPKLVYNA